jgi:hypothetical protein
VEPPLPVCLERARLVTAAKVWHAPLDSGEEHLPTHTLNNKKDYSCNRQVGLYPGENKRGMHPGEL